MANEEKQTRLQKIYERTQVVSDSISALQKERMELLDEVTKILGIVPGAEIEQRGRKYKVERSVGSFEHHPTDDDIVYGAARVRAAPATKNGFHARTRDFLTIVGVEFPLKWRRS